MPSPLMRLVFFGAIFSAPGKAIAAVDGIMVAIMGCLPNIK